MLASARTVGGLGDGVGECGMVRTVGGLDGGVGRYGW